jgi:hypothetical protein
MQRPRTRRQRCTAHAIRLGQQTLACQGEQVGQTLTLRRRSIPARRGRQVQRCDRQRIGATPGQPGDLIGDDILIRVVHAPPQCAARG